MSGQPSVSGEQSETAQEWAARVRRERGPLPQRVVDIVRAMARTANQPKDEQPRREMTQP